METLAAALAVLVGAVLQSATGFGFSMLASPLLFALIGPEQAVAASAVIAASINVATLGGERRRPTPLGREAVILCVCAIPGLLLGAVAVRELPTHVLGLIVAACVLAGLAVRLRARRRQDLRVAPAWSAPAAGVASGLMGNTTGMSGPPIILHLLGRGITPARMRDTFAVVFLGQGILGLGALAVAGSLDLPGGLWILVLTGLAGQVLGRSVFARLDAARYETLVLAVLAGAALVAVVSALA